MMDISNVQQVVTILEQLTRGELEAGEALSRWPDFATRNAILDRAWHDLSHFAEDADIRQRDRRYADYQIVLLKERIAEIKHEFGLD